jgi:MFS family permease
VATPAVVSSNKREPRLKNYAALTFTVLIAVSGAVMMTVTSSPNMKGAAFLWLPAALQLVAGVWLGPVRGFIAGGIGAYAAGIIAYGGWGLPDIIMNLVAGGLANSLLPGVLFRVARVDPALGSNPKSVGTGIIRILVLLVATVALGFCAIRFNWGAWGYLPSIILVLLAPLFLRDLAIKGRDLTVAIIIAIVISALSALIGSAGAVVAGQSWQAALLTVSLGWFLGDTVSSLLGLYVLAALTNKARTRGLSY